MANTGRGDVHKAIAAELRERIRLGELSPGDPLPSEESLAEQYGTSRSPARNALLALVREGLLTARPQAGYVVRAWDPAPVNVPLTGDGPEREAASVQIVIPPARVAEHFPGQSDVLCRQVVGQSVISSYYSSRALAAVPELGRPGPLPAGDLELLRQAGVALADQPQVQVRAFPPSPEDQALLKVTPETPLIEHASVVSDRDGQVLLVRVLLLAADRHFLESGR
ncbi:GntR family transcriptional regulator [Nonomuraea dietziae]|uniref:GntR family transcriptional regulator n=1 Tax=Nonomuraea dietziae TaxID=65515 RepID=UPI0033E97558